MQKYGRGLQAARGSQFVDHYFTAKRLVWPIYCQVEK